MCLPVVSSDYMFLCSKYGVRPTSTRNSIKDAVTHAFMASLEFFLSCMIFVFYSAASVE